MHEQPGPRPRQQRALHDLRRAVGLVFEDTLLFHDTVSANIAFANPDADDATIYTSQADAQGFVVLAKRWVVERTHAWNERARRLVMHHDRLPSVSEAWVWLTEARILLRRLTT